VEVIEHVEVGRNVVFSAYPGYGKTRLAVVIAEILSKRWGKVLLLTRSHKELDQICQLAQSEGIDMAILKGRASVCPFGVEDSATCSIMRIRNFCKVKRASVGEFDCRVERVYEELGACPYETMLSRALRSNIVALTYSYIASPDAVVIVREIVRGRDYALILDEGHNILSLEARTSYPLHKYCLRLGSYVRCYALNVGLDLLRKARQLVVTSASITRRFEGVFTRLFKNAVVVRRDNLRDDLGENLRVYVVTDLKITMRNRLRSEVLNVINRVLRTVVESVDGGVIAFFQSSDYLRRLVEGGLVRIPNAPLYLDQSELDEFRESARFGKAVMLTYYGSPISEGVNLIGREAKATILVGFPYPRIDRWFSLKAKAVEEILGIPRGEYAMFEAVSSTIQTVGRLLRSLDKERKVAVLLDERFWRYRSYYPPWLKDSLVRGSLKGLKTVFN